MKNKIEVDVKDVMRDCTVKVKLKGTDVMAWRLGIGLKLCKLAGKIMGAKECVIEFTKENDNE